MYKALILAVLGSVCTEPGPDPRIPVDSNELKPHQAEAQALLEEEFGVELDTTVYWTTTLCPYAPEGDDRTAVVVDGELCYSGLTVSCGEIYVADRGTLYGSAFVHELGHCVRLAKGMDGDGGHVDTEHWDRVRAQNIRVRDEGW